MIQIIIKPWGSEQLIEKNEFYVVKRLLMKKGHKCSLQFHEKKHETVYVLTGQLKLTVGYTINNLSEIILKPNDFYVIPPKIIHRMEAIQDSVYLESSTPQLTDVVRLQDDYARI